MSQSDNTSGRVRRFFNAEFLLRTARKIYIFIAGLGLIIAVVALCFAVIFKAIAFLPTQHESVPSEYTPKQVVLDPHAVDGILVPPSNIRFVANSGIDHPVGSSDALGYFDADTPSGLSDPPNDFDIMGGPDASSFDRAVVSVQSDAGTFSRTGLEPTQTLVDQINSTLATLKEKTSLNFSILVAAHDKFGRVSTPQKVVISLTLIPGTAPTAASSEASQTTKMAEVAKEIALHLDPNRTPLYFDAYNRAFEVPHQCGTSASDSNFVTNLDGAFKQIRDKLNVSNIEPFYSGVCSAWAQAIASEAKRAADVQAARERAIARNMEADTKAGIFRFKMNVATSGALVLAGAATIAFILIALFLAFLALENHSSVLRTAVNKLAERNSE